MEEAPVDNAAMVSRDNIDVYSINPRVFTTLVNHLGLDTMDRNRPRTQYIIYAFGFPFTLSNPYCALCQQLSNFLRNLIIKIE